MGATQMTAKQQPLVSVIVPCFNSAKTIARTLGTIVVQSYSNLEIIVVNDGSTDNTTAVVKKIGDSRISIIEKENGGVSTSRNAGIDAASGDFIVFIDSDDRIAEDMIEKMASKIMANPNSLVVCGKQIGERKITVPKDIDISKDVPKHVVTSILKNGHLYSPCNKIYNLKIIKEYNIRFVKKVNFGEDLIFNLDYLKRAESIYYLKGCLYFYDLTDGGESSTNKSDYKFRTIMLEHLRSYLGDRMKEPSIAIKYNLIQLRWRVSVERAKLKQGRKR